MLQLQVILKRPIYPLQHSNFPNTSVPEFFYHKYQFPIPSILFLYIPNNAKQSQLVYHQQKIPRRFELLKMDSDFCSSNSLKFEKY